jgi:DNA polymerase I-like protein with 3'-5' exonuclease and polymerase domains|tara:strand:- start:317 stop:2212 length:1896 start_codon:yes stop_codon:yes gene_type:complete
MKTNLQKPTWGIKTEWMPVEELPSTPSAIKEIAIDLETKDPSLKTHGPGWSTGNGDIAGISICYEGFNGYLPIGHEGGGNLDRKIILKWFEKEIANHSADKIFYNAAYDLGWLRRIGIKPQGRLLDVMLAAPLLNENRFSYSLNAVAYDYLGEMKSEAALREAAQEFGVDPKGELYKLPACFVGEYAEADARLTLQLWQTFKAELTKEDLWQVFNLETDVLPLCIEMTWRGVRVDLDEAERLKQALLQRVKTILADIKKQTDSEIELWAAASIAKLFDKLKLPYGRTKTGLPSFTKNFLTQNEHPIAQQIAEAREFDKIGNTFLSSIFRYAKKGRIHSHINQLRSESGGTVSGRISMSNPNLQQIPARNPDIARKIRSLFLPEEKEQWASMDFDQQEPRILVHFSSLTNKGLTGSDAFVHAYRTKDNTDFHQMVADIAGIPRKQAKTINLGIMYGMGQTKLAEQLDVTIEDAKRLLRQYHTDVPFVKELMDAVQRKVSHRDKGGFVRSLLGRKCRFDLWEPNLFVSSKALSKEEAHLEYGDNIKRAYTYKALNRLIQASAADQTKAAMSIIYKEKKKVPLIQIHDELAFSIGDKKEAKELSTLMEEAVSLAVPSPCDILTGKSWGALTNLD